MWKARKALLVLASTPTLIWGQAPDVDWSFNYGGSDVETSHWIEPTSDGGYIVGAKTRSFDGDITHNNGVEDVWILKLRQDGTLDWQQCYGGSGAEGTLCKTREMEDGGYIVMGGATSSPDGDVDCMIDNQLAWVFRLDLAGNMLWQRCLGGSLNDQLWSVAPSGTGCFVAGFTNSYDGDGVGNNGQSDMWVVKLDEAGGTVWSKCFGGSYIDTGRSVAATPDGGCIVAGETRSNDGDVDGINPYYTPPASVYTGWVVKLDAEGNMEWQACHGGPGSELLYAVAVAPDGSYWVAGRTTSTQGDISGHHGGTDGWVFRLGPTGDHMGQRCLGGSGTDEIRGIHVLPNGNALVTGFTNSSDGDVTDQFGSHDLWVILLDPELEIIWQLSLGGSELDAAWHVASAHEGGAVIAGYSASSDGHVPGNNGEADAWVIKLAPWDDIGVAANADPEQFTLFPNPATDMLHLQLPQWHSSPMPWSILDLTGREMAQGLATGERSVVPLGDLARGTYLFQLRDGPGIQVKRFVKQ